MFFYLSHGSPPIYIHIHPQMMQSRSFFAHIALWLVAMQHGVRHKAPKLNEVVAVNSTAHIAKVAKTAALVAGGALTRAVVLVSVLITPLRRAAWMPVT